jgi:hypothetical protein
MTAIPAARAKEANHFVYRIVPSLGEGVYCIAFTYRNAPEGL